MRESVIRIYGVKSKNFLGFILFGMLSLISMQSVLADTHTGQCAMSNGCDTDNCRSCCQNKNYDSGFCKGETADKVACICTEPLATAKKNKCKKTQ